MSSGCADGDLGENANEELGTMGALTAAGAKATVQGMSHI